MALLFIERPVADLQREVEEYAKKLDIARGNFQIAMVLNFAPDIDKSCVFSGGILVVSEN